MCGRSTGRLGGYDPTRKTWVGSSIVNTQHPCFVNAVANYRPIKQLPTKLVNIFPHNAASYGILSVQTAVTFYPHATCCGAHSIKTLLSLKCQFYSRTRCMGMAWPLAPSAPATRRFEEVMKALRSLLYKYCLTTPTTPVHHFLQFPTLWISCADNLDILL